MTGLLSGCPRSAEDPDLLATVGSVRFDATHLRDFEARQPEGERSEFAGLERHRSFLQNLIDRQVLLDEARAQHMELDEEVLRLLGQWEVTRLSRDVMRREVLDHCTVSPEEIEASYAQPGWGEKVVSREIFVADKEQADEAAALLGQGIPFDEVAKEYALDRALHAPAGAPQQFTYSPWQGPREVVQAVFSLPVGAITRPIPLMGGLVIAQVAERRKAKLDEVRGDIEKELKAARGKSLLEDYLRHAKDDVHLTMHPDGMEALLGALRQKRTAADLQPAEAHVPVYTFTGGVATVGELLQQLAATVSQWPAVEVERIYGVLKSSILPEKVMAADARRRGMDQDPQWQEQRQRELEKLMLVRMRSRAVASAQATEAEMAASYQAHLRQFRIPASARVQDLLVDDEERGRELAARCAAGEDLAGLIRQFSIRQNAGDGILLVYSAQAPIYGERWMQAVMEGPLNTVQGPLRTKGGYSVWRVLERQPESYYPLDAKRVHRAVERWVLEEKERTLFNDYLLELRRRRAGDIHIYTANLKRWAAAQTAGS